MANLSLSRRSVERIAKRLKPAAKENNSRGVEYKVIGSDETGQWFVTSARPYS